MKLATHILLSDYLTEKHLKDLSSVHKAAFRLGNQIPDRNPTTYLKGSIRSQFLKGHHFENAVRYMKRLCKRLEKGEPNSTVFWYNLGKLMHYIADAFTQCHNENFYGNIIMHRNYEDQLDKLFCFGIISDNSKTDHCCNNLFETILNDHLDYLHAPAGPETDATYILKVSQTVLVHLLREKIDESPCISLSVVV